MQRNRRPLPIRFKRFFSAPPIHSDMNKSLIPFSSRKIQGHHPTKRRRQVQSPPTTTADDSGGILKRIPFAGVLFVLSENTSKHSAEYVSVSTVCGGDQGDAGRLRVIRMCVRNKGKCADDIDLDK